MKNMFDKEALQESIARINKLQPGMHPQWGQMNPAQMLAHCAEAVDMAMGVFKPKRAFVGYFIGPMMKSFYTNDTPFRKSSPTSKELVMTGSEKDFEAEKARLIKTLTIFTNGGRSIATSHPHPFFGRFKPDQWGIGMYKHLDHHLKQFGV